MRIDRIDLIRFGHFADRDIELPARNPDFYMLYGDNEAGKSTLLRAISALLFGVPNKTQDTHTFKSSELRVGATLSAGNDVFSFRRRKGTTSTLLSANEDQLAENALAPFLPELDRERFEQFFALNHDRLREGGEELLRGKGDIGSALFQAAGLLDLRKLLDGLNKEANELFSPRSRGKVIGIALERYKNAKSVARQLAISWDTVREKRSELKAAQETLEGLKKSSEALQEELIRLRRIAGNKPDIARLQELRAALTELESIPKLPAMARRLRDDAQAEIANAAAQIKVLSEQISQRKQRIAELPLNPVLKTYAKDIEFLNSQIQDYVRSVNDLPNRMAERDEAIALADVEWKEVWRKRPISEADALKPVYDAQKASILELITEQARLSTSLEQAQEQVKTGEEEHERLLHEIALNPEPADPVPLLAAIDQAKSLGDTDQAAARLRTEIDRLNASAARELKAQRLYKGTVQELASVETPMLSTIDRYARKWEALTSRSRDLRAQLAALTESVRKKQSEAKALKKQLGKVAESDLAEVRALRDRLWQLLRASVIDKTISAKEAQKKGGISSITDACEEQIGRADEIADSRFANAQIVALHDHLAQEIDAAQKEQETIESEIERIEAEEQDLRGQWASEWKALTAYPLSPAEMKEWMQARQAILDRLEQSSEKEEQLRTIEQSASQAAAKIRTQLKKVSGPAKGDDESLGIFLKVAEKCGRDLEQRSRRRADLERQLQSLGMEKRRAKLEECKLKLAQWSQRWTPVMRALLLPEVATPLQASKALLVLEKVYKHLLVADQLKHRIRRINENIDSFKISAAKLVSAIDPSLGSVPPDKAIAHLHLRYQEAGKAETERETREAENASDEIAVSSWRTRQQAGESTLNQLREAAKCSANSELETIIAACEQREAKREEYDLIASGLITRNTVPDLKQIELEAAGYELDSLRAQIDSSDRRLKELQEGMVSAGPRFGELRKEFERLETDSESAFESQKAEEALANIRPAVSQYLRLSLASEAVQRAIESYREKHQGPVLKRAGDVFSALTLRDFSGLTMAFGADDKPVLVAVRKSGEKVEVEGLSDGTRDQLYLSLRLAFIEHHIARVAPCPVILDDILINADDRRSLAALKVIEELAGKTQVLFFTHHHRLVDLGKAAGAEIVEFGAMATAAIA